MARESVGRERQLAELVPLLANSRLLTLTGAGGLGKTRLGTPNSVADDAGLPDSVGNRTAAPRHQTLLAAIDLSYDLLDAAERALFERLSGLRRSMDALRGRGGVQRRGSRSR